MYAYIEKENCIQSTYPADIFQMPHLWIMLQKENQFATPQRFEMESPRSPST